MDVSGDARMRSDLVKLPNPCGPDNKTDAHPGKLKEINKINVYFFGGQWFSIFWSIGVSAKKILTQPFFGLCQ